MSAGLIPTYCAETDEIARREAQAAYRVLLQQAVAHAARNVAAARLSVARLDAGRDGAAKRTMTGGVQTIDDLMEKDLPVRQPGDVARC